MDPGLYSLSIYSKTNTLDRQINSNEIHLEVLDIEEEELIVFKNKSELVNLATINNGTYYEFNNYIELLSKLKNTDSMVLNKFEFSIRSIHKLLFIVIFLIIIEWIYRKNYGML